MLSRNFRLQKVGDFAWIKKYYNFEKIAFSIDELIILDVSRTNRNIKVFSQVVKEVISNVFIPVSVGGGIRTIDDADLLLKSGADKVVINSSIYRNNNLVKDLVKKYGSQFIVAAVDYKNENDNNIVYIENGNFKIQNPLSDYLQLINKLEIGEVYLNSIDKDGTGQGLDLNNLSKVLSIIKTPLILAGGAGNEIHLAEALKHDKVDAVATANLFNFIGDSLPKSRDFIINQKIKIANWK